jgi:type III secretion protein S
MNYAILSNEIYTNFRAGAILAGVPMLIAMALGLVLSILQAATQIQDQTLPSLIKVIVIVGVLIGFGYPLSAPLVDKTRTVFTTFHLMTRQ